MQKTGFTLAASIMVSCLAVANARGGQELTPNGGFENGFTDWTLWGDNADRISLDKTIAHLGTSSARLQFGHNALYFFLPLEPGTAYELRFFYRLDGDNRLGQVALSYMKKAGAFASAGREVIELPPVATQSSGEWAEFRKIFMPTRLTDTCQVALKALNDSTLWVDDVSLQVVPRPAGMTEPPDPWDGLLRRTADPLFQQLLTDSPGNYSVSSWSHDLRRKGKTGFKSEDMKDDAKWQQAVQAIFTEAGQAGMGFMTLPGSLSGAEPWHTEEFHRQQHNRYGVRFDVWTEGSASVYAGLKNGAELLNPAGKALGGRAFGLGDVG